MMNNPETRLRNSNFEAIVEDIANIEEIGGTVENEALSRLYMGPLRAFLYITPTDEMQLTTAFIDEERGDIYRGLSEIISKIPEKLIKLKEERPARFLHERAWQDYLRNLWKIVLDKDYFQNSGW